MIHFYCLSTIFHKIDKKIGNNFMFFYGQQKYFESRNIVIFVSFKNENFWRIEDMLKIYKINIINKKWSHWILEFFVICNSASKFLSLIIFNFLFFCLLLMFIDIYWFFNLWEFHHLWRYASDLSNEELLTLKKVFWEI